MSQPVKPIKRSPALVAFSKDHHFGLLLVWKIRQGLRTGISPVRITNYVLFFYKEHLVLHFEDEEKFLFSPFSADDQLVKQALDDHAHLHNLVRLLEAKFDDLALLEQLAGDLERHIRFEERELFNHFQATLDEDRLSELVKTMPDRPAIKDEDWEDRFWEYKK
jgi:hypothetical protein